MGERRARASVLSFAEDSQENAREREAWRRGRRRSDDKEGRLNRFGASEKENGVDVKRVMEVRKREKERAKVVGRMSKGAA